MNKLFEKASYLMLMVCQDKWGLPQLIMKSFSFLDLNPKMSATSSTNIS